MELASKRVFLLSSPLSLTEPLCKCVKQMKSSHSVTVENHEIEWSDSAILQNIPRLGTL